MASALRLLARWLLRPWRTDPIERLRGVGVRIGANLSLQPGVVLDESHGWLIRIGDDVTLAPRVVVLAHDASTRRALGATRIGRVSIGDRCFIGGNTVILPGVDIGSDCIVGAGSVVARSLPAGSVAAGNPARVLGSTKEYLDRRRLQQAAVPAFDRRYTLAGGISDSMKQQMVDRLDEQPWAYVE